MKCLLNKASPVGEHKNLALWRAHEGFPQTTRHDDDADALLSQQPIDDATIRRHKAMPARTEQVVMSERADGASTC